MYPADMPYSHSAPLIPPASLSDAAWTPLANLAPRSGLLGYAHATASAVFTEGMLPAGSYLAMRDNLPDYIELYRICLSLENSPIAVFSKSCNPLNSMGGRNLHAYRSLHHFMEKK